MRHSERRICEYPPFELMSELEEPRRGEKPEMSVKKSALNKQGVFYGANRGIRTLDIWYHKPTL